MSAVPTYPVRAQATLERPLNRWLWLVKWLVAIPHYVVLVFLWVAFIVLSVVALVAILFTGRYPRSIFDFNLGVLRWTGRVHYYTYSALATDRYPPFTLASVPDYPATLESPIRSGSRAGSRSSSGGCWRFRTTWSSPFSPVAGSAAEGSSSCLS